ncbi:hypothetical protein [Gimesia sp.]|uniref:hypothetical protein n=1 Tax=Gimesia sp. TaxID=2024833 RepID=UPI003A8E274E
MALEIPPTTTLSARDLLDAISETFWASARDNADYMIDLMREGRLLSVLFPLVKADFGRAAGFRLLSRWTATEEMVISHSI